MEEKIQKYQEIIFENIRHTDEFGNEFWYARELMKVIKYTKWQNFEKVINKAKASCENSNNNVNYWFTEVSKPIISGKGKKEFVKDYMLTRYACYLIVQNGDSRKKEIALGQSYFAVQTRKMEVLEDYMQEYDNMPEDEKRLFKRKQIKRINFDLNKTAKEAGVRNFDKFHNAGYKGLYNGETANDIAKRKGLRYREDILDNMCSDELIANEFRISLTNQKLKQEQINGDTNASNVHYEMGKLVRNTIKEAGTTLPEDFPTPDKSIKELNKEELKKLKGGSSFTILNSIIKKVIN